MVSKFLIVIKCGCSRNLTCPLNVYAVLFGDFHPVGDEVVLHGREGLHDVTSLAPHVQIVQPTAAVLCSEQVPRTQHDHVRPVLEGTAKLGRVDGQTKRFVVSETNIHVGVLLHRRAQAPGQRKRYIKDFLTHYRLSTWTYKIRFAL